ncbi:MAG: glycosyltransferase [Cyanobacteria bacterium SID2]|nr:glycosyltransferase [Cyanobacteria bacterium SID2]
MPSLSVVLAVDRDRAALDRSIASVLSQTIDDVEILLPTDDTLPSTLAETHVRCIPCEDRSTVGRINAGLRAAAGAFVAILTGGERWRSDKLQQQRAALDRHPNAAVAYCWTDWTDENDTVTRPDSRTAVSGNVLPFLLLTDFLETPSNVLVRRSAIDAVGELAPELGFGAVWDWSLRLAAEFEFVCTQTVGVLAAETADSELEFDRWERDLQSVLDLAFDRTSEHLHYLKPKSSNNLYKFLAHRLFRGNLTPRSRTAATRFVRIIAERDPQFRQQSETISAALLTAANTGELRLASVLPSWNPECFAQSIERHPRPKISVVIPAYNSEATIRDTLDSLFAQTWTDFEVIVIDDGSSDDTLEILQACEDIRLRVFSFPNAGPSTARNRGFEKTLGEYVSFLDADDRWTPDKLEAQLNALEAHPDAAVAYSWTDYIDESGQFVRSGSHLTVNGDGLSHLLLGDFLENGSNALIRREAFATAGGFDKSLLIAHDWALFLKLAARHFIVCVPRAQILYRLTSDSVSSKVVRLERECLQVLDEAFDRAPQAFQVLRSRSLANLYQYLLYRSLQRPWTAEKCSAAVRFVEQLLAIDPAVGEYRELLASIAAASIAHSTLSARVAQQLYPESNPGFRPEDLFQYTRSRPYPAISVIMPAYNAETTIRETLESVLNQTFTDFEIIVIDDGSIDRTVEVVKSIDDYRIKVFSYPNAGQGESRNRGACHATGEFFTFLDSDDLWTRDKLESQYRAIVDWQPPTDSERCHENRKPAVAYSWVDWIDENGKYIDRGCDYSCNGYIYPKLLLSDFIAGGSNAMMWRGAFYRVKGFNPTFPPAEDRDMWLRLSEQFHFVCVPEAHLLYRQVPTSQSANVERMERSQLRVLEAAFRRASQYPPFTKTPELLPLYRRQTYANSYKYLTFKALDGKVDRQRGRLAARLFSTVLRNEPQLWQHRRFVLKLWLRIIATALLPPELTQKILDRFPTFPKLHRELLLYTKMDVTV